MRSLVKRNKAPLPRFAKFICLTTCWWWPMELDTRNFLLWSVKVKQEKELLMCLLNEGDTTSDLKNTFPTWSIFLPVVNHIHMEEKIFSFPLQFQVYPWSRLLEECWRHDNRPSKQVFQHDLGDGSIRKQRGKKTPYFCSGWDGWGRNSRTWPFWLHSCNRETAGTAAVPRMNFHLILSSSSLSADQDILPDPRI